VLGRHCSKMGRWLMLPPAVVDTPLCRRQFLTDPTRGRRPGWHRPQSAVREAEALKGATEDLAQAQLRREAVEGRPGGAEPGATPGRPIARLP